MEKEISGKEALKEKRKIKIKNQLDLWLFCVLIGAVAGALVWVILKVMSLGMELIWTWIPGKISMPYYTLIVCTAGGVIIGVFRKIFGDYPEELETVMGKVKKEKRYDYSHMFIMIIAALLPLLIGSSVGPEAGLTGIIVGLCYWAGENLKFAKQHTREYSQIGIAVSLSVLFHAPLFGIFEVEEDSEEFLQSESAESPNVSEKIQPENSKEGESTKKESSPAVTITKSSKIFIYGIALAAGTGIYAGLSALFGAGMSGFPSFDTVEIQRIDYVLMILYMICGCVLAYFYETTHAITEKIADKIPGIIKETLAGLLLGLIGMAVPAVMFSGEEQMEVLMRDYAGYFSIVLIAIAFLKVLLTNVCIQFGLKGGHFFPVIFAGVCMGYGVAMLCFGKDGSHVVFAAAIVTATLLGGIMKKPLAVTMLLFLCFPVKMFLWIFIAAAVGSKCSKK